MADDIIKSFLVRIGYKHDEVAMRKITDGINSVTKSVLALGAGIAAVSTTVAYTVTRIASNLEALYFASKKTGDSATSLKAFDLAAQRMGASAGSGLSAAQSLAAFFRNTPAGTGATLLHTWFGVDADEKDPVKTLLGIAGAMQKMEYFQAKMYGNAAGLSDDQVWFLRQPGLVEKYSEMLKNLGPNFEKATKDAHEFENQLQDLETTLEGFAIQVQDVLEKKMGFSIKNLNTWLKAHGQEIANNIVKHLEEFLQVLNRLAPKLEWLLDKFIELDKKTNGWSTAIIGMSVLMPGLVAGVISLAAAFARLGVGAAAAGLGALAGVLGPAALVAAAGGIGAVIGSAVNNKFPGLSSYLGGKMLDMKQLWDKMDRGYLFLSGNQESKQNWAMEQFQKMGWTSAQAAGMVANATAESSMDPNAVNASGHRGLFQWDKSRWAGLERFAKIAGLDPSDPLAQVRYVDYEQRYGHEQMAGRMLLAAQNANSAGRAFSQYYERPGSSDEDARRGGMAVSLEHNTTVHIDGSMEPQAVARHVADAQERAARNSAAALTREWASLADAR